MSNLIERLRDEPHWYSIRRHGLTTPECEVWHRTCCRAADEIERLLMLGKIQADRLNEALVEIERLQARVETLEGAIKDTISSFYTDKPPYYQIHHEVGDMLEQALAATEQGESDGP